MVDVPLLSKMWKPKPIDDGLQDVIDGAKSEGYNQAIDDVEEENMYIKDKPLPEDDKQFWAGTVFKPVDVQGSGISRKVLPSLAMSNYPEHITLEREIYPYKNRIIYLKVGIVEKWLTDIHELYADSENEDTKKDYLEAMEILRQYMAMLLAKLDVDSRTRLSVGMEGLKEVNTKRGEIKRNQNRPLNEKIGVNQQ
jgi:hypothetical protein